MIFMATPTEKRLERISSGIPGLDQLISGGFVPGSVNLIAGMTGTGKTILCLQFALNCLKKGEKVVYLTLEEGIDDILNDVAEFGWKSELENFIKMKKFFLAERPATDIMAIKETVTELIHESKAKIFLLDSLSVATLGWSES